MGKDLVRLDFALLETIESCEKSCKYKETKLPVKLENLGRLSSSNLDQALSLTKNNPCSISSMILPGIWTRGCSTKDRWI